MVHVVNLIRFVYISVEVSILYVSYLVSVSAGGPEIPKDTRSQVLPSTSNDSYILRAAKLSVFKCI